jgi:hypothetical protein
MLGGTWGRSLALTPKLLFCSHSTLDDTVLATGHELQPPTVRCNCGGGSRRCDRAAFDAASQSLLTKCPTEEVLRPIINSPQTAFIIDITSVTKTYARLNQ